MKNFVRTLREVVEGFALSSALSVVSFGVGYCLARVMQ